MHVAAEEAPTVAEKVPCPQLAQLVEAEEAA